MHVREILTRLAEPPAEHVIRWGWTLWIAWTVVGTALALGDRRAGLLGIGLILAAPFWVLWLAWPVLRAGQRLLAYLLSRGGPR